MTEATPESLSLEARLAIAHTPPELRPALTIFLELDLRLSRIVAGTSEPMLGQMRLAWWREQLGQAIKDRPAGDAVLDGIGRHWSGQESALVSLVDGWEYMLAETLDPSAAEGFAQGRAAPFAALARMAGPMTSAAPQTPARRWALVDAGVHVPDGEERELLFSLARAQGDAPRLPRGLRGLAVLDALARRSLERGGQPLMQGRGAALTAARAAIFGR